MRVILMGTPDFAVPTLDALHAAGHEIVLVVDIVEIVRRSWLLLRIDEAQPQRQRHLGAHNVPAACVDHAQNEDTVGPKKRRNEASECARSHFQGKTHLRKEKKRKQKLT